MSKKKQSGSIKEQPFLIRLCACFGNNNPNSGQIFMAIILIAIILLGGIVALGVHSLFGTITENVPEGQVIPIETTIEGE